MTVARKIVLCADDYGLSPAVSRAIRELLGARRLTATSCMVVYPEFSDDGPQLREFGEQADIGLHFTLTHERPLASLLVRGWFRRLDPAFIKAELDQQLDRFIAIVGGPPAYIDGHQHVHLLPGVREPVIDAARRIGAYVRLTREPIGPAMMKRPAPVDSLYLSWASQPLARHAKRQGVLANNGFRGARSFKERASFRDLFRRMIAEAANGSIVMCHPGHVDEALSTRDPIHRQREGEFAYLSGDTFEQDLRDANLQLSTLREALAGRPPDHLPFSTAAA